MRILYISNGVDFPEKDPILDPFHYLSEIGEGEVLYPIYHKNELPEHLRLSFPLFQVGRFTYHLARVPKSRGLLRTLWKAYFYLRTGLRLQRERPFDAIICYGTNATGICGVLLKWITGAKLIVEIPNAPENNFRFDTQEVTLPTRVKRRAAHLSFLAVCSVADCMRVLYPWQLSRYPSLQNKRTVVSQSLVPVNRIKASQIPCDRNYLLSVGYPWHIKGFDVLIRAFKAIAPNFPDYKLRLVGFMPDPEHLIELADGSPQIELLPPLPYLETQRQMSECTVYVSASRTEGVARVLIEAMAARKPIIASAVGGSPHLIKDNECGMLFESENVDQLSEKLAQMLSDSHLRERLAKRAYDVVQLHFDERAYVRAFQKMLEVEPTVSPIPAQSEK